MLAPDFESCQARRGPKAYAHEPGQAPAKPVGSPVQTNIGGLSV